MYFRPIVYKPVGSSWLPSRPSSKSESVIITARWPGSFTVLMLLHWGVIDIISI